jgi:hypothetical protein
VEEFMTELYSILVTTTGRPDTLTMRDVSGCTAKESEKVRHLGG